MTMFTIVLIAFAAGVVVGVVWFSCRSTLGDAGEKEPDVIEKQRVEKDENLARLRAYVQERGRITNDEVERELGVSDATATRYLDILEEEGIIRQVGTEGRSVYYERQP